MTFWAFLNNHVEIVVMGLVFAFFLAVRVIDRRDGDGR